MSNPLGANAWIWVSPLTDERLADLAPRVRAWGFDILELPIEQHGDWDPARAAEVLAGARALRPTVCVAMGPGRELCATDAGTVASTQAFLKECIDTAAVLGAGCIAGPIYASVGRTWRMSAGRAPALLRRAARRAAARRRVRRRARRQGRDRAARPLRDERHQHGRAGARGDRRPARRGLRAAASTPTTRTWRRRTSPAAFTLAGDRLAHVHASANDRGAPGRRPHRLARRSATRCARPATTARS